MLGGSIYPRKRAVLATSNAGSGMVVTDDPNLRYREHVNVLYKLETVTIASRSHSYDDVCE